MPIRATGARVQVVEGVSVVAENTRGFSEKAALAGAWAGFWKISGRVGADTHVPRGSHDRRGPGARYFRRHVSDPREVAWLAGAAVERLVLLAVLSTNQTVAWFAVFKSLVLFKHTPSRPGNYYCASTHLATS